MFVNPDPQKEDSKINFNINNREVNTVNLCKYALINNANETIKPHQQSSATPFKTHRTLFKRNITKCNTFSSNEICIKHFQRNL